MKYNKPAFILILLGTVAWSLTMVRSALNYSFGQGYWGPNGHDGIWHVSLARSLSKGTLGMPIFDGGTITNYHLGFDLILAALSKVTSLPVFTLYFQIIPPLLALFIGLFCYKFVYSWRNSAPAAFWATFFVYFGGSLGWLVSLFRHGTFSGESMFWSQQSISTLINPPFALSLLMLFMGLNFLVTAKGSRRNVKLVAAGLLFGLLMQVKAYAGVLAIGSLFVTAVYQYLLKKELWLFFVFAISIATGAVVFLPFNREAATMIEVQPFWFVENMMALSDRLGWDKYYSAMFNYRAGGLRIRAAIAYFFAFLIFVIGNLSIRIAGFAYFLRNRGFDLISVFLFVFAIGGLLLPMSFVQQGTPWNTIQFFYYTQMIASVLTGIVLSRFLEKLKRPLAIKMSAAALILTAPTTMATLAYDYLPPVPPSQVSHNELEALRFLEDQPEGVVLIYPFDRHKAKEALDNPPRPLYLYESTAYVSAYTGKPVCLEDEVNLNITGFDWQARREELYRFFREDDPKMAEKFLLDNNIRYLYLTKRSSPVTGELMKAGPDQIGLVKVFENQEVIIFARMD